MACALSLEPSADPAEASGECGLPNGPNEGREPASEAPLATRPSRFGG